MIPIKRPPVPAFLSEVGNPWLEETEQAKKHYQGGATDSFDFKLYNHSTVKDELKKTFVKCAYCESNYGAVFDGDVEHFRPKGKVSEKTPQTPGYYWLANEWDNLFLACQHCNQRRKHLLDGETKLTGLGKLDQFPIEPKEHRMHSPTGDFAREEQARLLLNPCTDDPIPHLAYEPEEGVVVPLTLKGKKSVEVFALQRPYLVKERKKRLLEVFAQIDRVKRVLVLMNQQPAVPEWKRWFTDELSYLLSYSADHAPYAGMCRFFTKKFLQENNLTA
jgi:hypothetical protein